MISFPAGAAGIAILPLGLLAEPAGVVLAVLQVKCCEQYPVLVFYLISILLEEGSLNSRA